MLACFSPRGTGGELPISWLAPTGSTGMVPTEMRCGFDHSLGPLGEQVQQTYFTDHQEIALVEPHDSFLVIWSLVVAIFHREFNKPQSRRRSVREHDQFRRHAKDLNPVVHVFPISLPWVFSSFAPGSPIGRTDLSLAPASQAEPFKPSGLPVEQPKLKA